MSGPGARYPDAVDRVLAGLIDRAAQPPAVLDVGGGSGTRAVPLAARGCTVTVVDSSIDALAMLRRRAADARVSERVVAIQADADSLDSVVGADSADLVLCHHLLESVDVPAATVRGLARAVRPGGLLSVLVTGRYAAVLNRVAAGRYAEAAAMQADPDGRAGRHDPLQRRFDVATVSGLLADAGLEVDSVTGLGVITALGRAEGASGTPGSDEMVVALEAVLAGDPVLRELATDLHVLARRIPG